MAGIDQLEEFLGKTLPTIIRQVKGKQVIIFLGKTRSGKSTLVNYLLNKPLQAEKQQILKNQFRIVSERGSTIGHGSVSATTLPNIYEDEYVDAETRETFTLVDAPGFHDNRGIDQQIINAICVNVLLKFPRIIKIVLTSDIADLVRDDRSCFIDLNDMMAAIAPQLLEIQPGVSIIFTKDRDGYDRNSIANLLKVHIVDSFNNASFKLVDHFVANPEKIGFFHMPQVEGPLTEEVNGLIDETIRNCDPIAENREFQFVLSPEARLRLSEIIDRKIDNSDFEILLKKVLQPYVTFGYAENLEHKDEQALTAALNNINGISTKFEEFKTTIGSLSDIVRVIRYLHERNVHVIYSPEFSTFLVLLQCQAQFELFTTKQVAVLLHKFKAAINSVIVKADDYKAQINTKLTSIARWRFIKGLAMVVGAIIGFPLILIGAFAGGAGAAADDDDD